MGLFLTMSSVVGADISPVVSALARYADANQGTFHPQAFDPDDDSGMFVSQSQAGTTVLHPPGFYFLGALSEFLSADLQAPAFSFHIHDGAFWMYLLFDKGKMADQFNPIPDYFECVTPEERGRWLGNPQEVAKRVPGVLEDSIEKYLVQWGEGLSDEKAYEDDLYGYCDELQLEDFLKRVGFEYPYDDDGNPHGSGYQFVCKPSAKG
ncbi:MAG: hypothetical protein JRH20_24170 [Deltaproteobacteria bacterium]|nr:hypothetical protein [Deltaproteobacteria bacterium]